MLSTLDYAKNIVLQKLGNIYYGTVVYASTNALIGKETSRRDDLISLGYMLIVLIKRNIPLNVTFKNFNKEKFTELLNLKKTGEKLYRGIPKEIKEFMKYSKNLKFEQDPDYSYLRSLFTNILMSTTLNYKKLTFSWIKSKDKKLLGNPRNYSFRKSSPQYRILQNIKEKRKNQLSAKGLKLDKILKENNNNNNIYEKLLNINKFNKARTEKNNIKNYINNSELNEINSKKEIEPNHIKYIPLPPKKKFDNNIRNPNPILKKNTNNYISRNIKIVNDKIFTNNNQKSYININFYTNNTIFQRNDQESGFKFNNSSNYKTDKYTRNNNNNENIHHLNTISNTKDINYVKNIRNENNKIRKYILIRNKIKQNNSKNVLDKNDKILSSSNSNRQKILNAYYIPFKNKNNLINYDIKNEEKLISDKIIKSKLVKRKYQNSRIQSRNNNEINSKILNFNNLKMIQSYNDFNYSNNIKYRSPIFNNYNRKNQLKKYISNTGEKAIYKDRIKSDIDLTPIKINTNMNRNNKNQNLKSLQDENYLKFNYAIKDNYLPLESYSEFRINKNKNINRLNTKSMSKNYNSYDNMNLY